MLSRPLPAGTCSNSSNGLEHYSFGPEAFGAGKMCLNICIYFLSVVILSVGEGIEQRFGQWKHLHPKSIF